MENNNNIVEQPKEIQKEIPKVVQVRLKVAQEQAQGYSCNTCKYQFKPYEDEPCVNCFNGWADAKDSKWETREQPEEIQKEIPKGAEDDMNRCDMCGSENGDWEPEEIQKEILKGSAADSEHYKKQEIQSIEVMQMVMSYEKFLGFLEGNIIKYSMRCGLKDDPKQEKTKIKQYKMWLDMARVGQIIDPRVHVYKEDNKNE